MSPLALLDVARRCDCAHSAIHFDRPVQCEATPPEPDGLLTHSLVQESWLFLLLGGVILLAIMFFGALLALQILLG
ncbi:hypothetical protein [Paraburkholderia sp. J11-2]|uniref:hypothetical protein n=1 Tax=Paraburkholderia sp. J11-2 TaxID=2805431 RepID=UPI002AB7D30D|nr:hypothetical protein [Paraburkholderia sp. J11-2]